MGTARDKPQDASSWRETARSRRVGSALLLTVLTLGVTLAGCRLRRIDDGAAPSGSTSAAAASALASTPPSAFPTPAPGASASVASSASAPEQPQGPEGTVVIGLGGAGSRIGLSSGVLAGVRASVRAISDGQDPLDAVTAGVVLLENNPAFNAGRGSSVRLDGNTIQMDAALMDSEGKLGAVAAVTQGSNPILLARIVADKPQSLLVGGADLTVKDEEQAPSRLDASSDAGVFDAGVDAREDATVPEPPGNVAIVLRTPAGVFVAAASDGGRPTALPGYVGAVPIPGASIFAGPKGAVAASGPDHLVVHALLARMVYERLAQTGSPRQAAMWGLKQLAEDTDAGLVVLNRRAYHIETRGPMAWATWTSTGETIASEREEGDAKP